MKRILVFFLLLCLFVFSGCSAKNLIATDNFIDNIEYYMPNAEFVSMTSEKNSNSFGENTYVFDNGDFVFKYINNISISDYGNSNDIKSNYLESLFNYFSDELERLADKNNFVIISSEITNEELYSLMINNKEKSFIYIDFNDFDFLGEMFTSVRVGRLSLNVYINDFSHIENIYYFFEDSYGLVKDYLPKYDVKYGNLKLKYNIYSFENLKEYIEDRNNNILYSKEVVLKSKGSNINFYEEPEWVKLVYANNVRDGKINNISLSYKEALTYCPLEIERLFVNNNEVKCENGISFLYNIEDGRYYTRVYCGSSIEKDNTLKGEYYQKVLLEEIYNDVEYNSDDKGNKTTYTINEDTYNIINQSYLGGFKFSKNGKNLSVKDLEWLPFIEESNTDYQYISVDDLSVLLGLRVQEIDILHGVIYLSVK